MNLDYETMLTEFPDPTGWDFGDYPYGLEPLVLPKPGARTPAGTPDPAGLAALRDRLAEPVVAATDGPGLSAESLIPLYWFRWITGHQVAFILWRLVGRALDDVRSGRAAPAALHALSDYVRGYAIMLVYTSSCTRDVYERVIRLTMLLQHRWFSGLWAPDYEGVRNLLRGRVRRLAGGGPAEADLAAAVELCQAVHLGVAAKLVPNGRSFLQELSSAGRLRRARMQGEFYDNYFLTSRGDTTEAEVTGQLLRRLHAVSLDIANNGMYPVAPVGVEELPEELTRPDVVDCVRDVEQTLRLIADHAIGRQDRPVMG